MPVIRRASAPHTTTKNGQMGGWLSNFLARRYARPVVAVLVLIVLGMAAVFWAMAVTTISSLWSDSAVPATLASADTNGTELGLRFRSNVAGYVTGVRFYKSAQNTGTHTGNLWDENGNLLASVKFANETASGWQTANFSKPVSIASGINYVVSYHAPNGHYSYNTRYFSNAAYSNRHLTALRSVSTHPNGIYTQSTGSSTFPTSSGDGTNYWVDILFSSNLLGSRPAPAAPTGVSVAVQDGPSALISWQAGVGGNPVGDYNIYRDGTKIVTVGMVSAFSDTAVTAGTTYNYQVQAVDNTGARSTLSQAATVTVPATTATGGGITDTTTCPLPKYPSSICTGVPVGTSFTKTVTGDYNAVTNGEVLDSWRITGDLIISASNVTVKNTQIDGNITNEGPTGGVYKTASFTVTDSTIGSTTCNSDGQPGVNGHDFTARRVYIRGHQDGVDVVGSNVAIADSYIQPCYLPPSVVGGDGYHTDGVQDQCDSEITSVCAHITLTHNTVDVSNINSNTAVNLGSAADGLAVADVTLQDNLLLGGGYTTGLNWDNVGDQAKWVVNNNAWVQGTWAYGAADTNGTCANQAWSNNNVVTVDSTYAVISKVRPQACVN